jgi:hypothetical protein
MPYALFFRRQVPIADRERYINECCVGGDAVTALAAVAIALDAWFFWFALRARSYLVRLRRRIESAG